MLFEFKEAKPLENKVEFRLIANPLEVKRKHIAKCLQFKELVILGLGGYLL